MTIEQLNPPAVVLSTAQLDAVHCPNCPDQGWYEWETGGYGLDGENDTRQCEQVQCQFCWETPNSVFNINAANAVVSGGTSATNAVLNGETLPEKI